MALDWQDGRNLSMLIDYYELTMANGYLENGMGDREAVFELFFRRIPDGGGFAVCAGLEQFIDYINELQFTDADIAYLESKGQFSKAFLQYLRTIRFVCDVWAVKEGTPVFPGEPMLVVKGPIIQAQLIETMALLTINYQSLVATKANRLVRAAEGRTVFEFGSRRAQGYDAAILGARAAYIGGCDATACAIADREFGIPAVGTMAHSWVQAFDSEYESFATYARQYPSTCALLVDTYNTLRSGVPNAIRAFDEIVKPTGHRPVGIRIDSGDIAYLSKAARQMLDEAGYPDVKIIASNSLDEYIIRDLLLQGAKVDMFGVGENLITSKSDPIFGGVYKMTAMEDSHGTLTGRIKLSETEEKITTPGFKNLYRLFSRENNKALADYVTLRDEVVDTSTPLTIFDPIATWKQKTLVDFEAACLLEPVFRRGEQCYQSPKLLDIRAFCQAEIGRLWDEVKRFEYPHRYYVDLSRTLWQLKQDLLRGHSGS